LKKSIIILLLFAYYSGLDLYARNDHKELPTHETNDQMLVPGTGQYVPWNLLEGYTPKDSNEPAALYIKQTKRQHFIAVDARRHDDLFWNLQHVDDNADYYLSSGAAGDTFAVVFTAAAPGIVSEVYMQWFTAGTIQAFAADYDASAMSISPDGECSSIDSGSFLGTPIGAMRTPVTSNTIEGYVSDWSYQLDIGGHFIVGDSTNLSSPPNFVIAVIKDDVNPMPLADATSDRGDSTYTWFGGPWQNGFWSNYSPQVDLMMLVKMTYPYCDLPPLVQNLSIVSNTYDTAGPFTIFADIFGPVSGGIGIDESDSIRFHWTISGAETIDSMTPIDVDMYGNGLYAYDIVGDFTVSDELEYWVTTGDAFNFETMHQRFLIKAPEHPDADILIVADNASDPQTWADLYRRAADELGLVYEFWDTSIEKGIDASVINAGWSNILVYGWTTDIVPAIAGEDDPGFAAFLDNGGNLVLADQDWFFSHGLARDLQFDVGDFAYDYMGLEAATNDPYDGEETLSDSLFYGVAGTAIDSEFMSNPLILNHTLYGTSNWSDHLVPGNSASLFRGASDSMIYAVAYDASIFKTAYFGFMPDAAIELMADNELDFQQFKTWFEGTLHWLGIVTNLSGEPERPIELMLAQNFPNPFNPSTTIHYELAETTDVSLIIYDITGREINRLVLEQQSAGHYDVIWSGMNNDGSLVSTGVYFVRLQAGEFSKVVKMVYLK